MLLRERLSRSQSVACAEVQAGAFRGLQVQHPQKLARPSDSLVGVSRRVERDKKTRARELVIAGGARNGRLWRARTLNICG